MTILNLKPDATTGKDTYIREFNPDTENGGASVMWIGLTFTSSALRRGLIQFDLSSIPSNAIVLSATLSLHCIQENVATNYDATVHRGLNAWFEGNGNLSTPSGGEDASTWNNRNHNGTVAWTGGAGGGAGDDYEATPTDTVSITGINTWFDFDVTPDVQNFISGVTTNFGWWVLGVESAGEDTLKAFVTSDDSGRPEFWPELEVEYVVPEGLSAGTSTVSGTLVASGNLAGESTGTATVTGTAITNEYMEGTTAGNSITSATIRATGYLVGLISGSVLVEADIIGKYYAVASSLGLSEATGDIFAIYRMVGLAEGSSQVQGEPSFEGQLRGQSNGTSTALALGWARAKSVIQAVECNFAPLLYLTDGTVKNNGQLNLVDFLVKTNGFLLQNYRPQIAQYKEGGRFSSGPLSQGRRLRYRNFDNAIDVFELSIASYDQDGALGFIHELLAFQEAAADYWVSDYKVTPVYLVARSPRETYERYATVHMISIPELQNPYSQNFFSRYNAQMTLTVRIERGHWLDVPPGRSECVAISSVRSWTVSEWQTGS